MPKQSSTEKAANGRYRAPSINGEFRFVFSGRASVYTHLCCRDRRKLTFYFVADKRIDFRELVRELFRCVFSESCYQERSHSFAHVDCIKRGSGWHPFRDLLASSSDHISSSPPFESPTSFKISPFLGSLLYISSTALLFVYLRGLINACLVWCQASCMNFGAIFHPVLEFFWTLLASADNIPNQPSYCTVFFFLLPFQLRLLLSHASSVLVLITTALSTFCLRLPVFI